MAGTLIPYRASKRDQEVIAYPVSQYVNILAGVTTSEATTVPTGASFVRITSLLACWMNRTTTAAAADVTDGTGSVLIPPSIPVVYKLNGETALNFYAASSTTICLEYFS